MTSGKFVATAVGLLISRRDAMSKIWAVAGYVETHTRTHTHAHGSAAHPHKVEHVGTTLQVVKVAIARSTQIKGVTQYLSFTAVYQHG